MTSPPLEFRRHHRQRQRLQRGFRRARWSGASPAEASGPSAVSTNVGRLDPCLHQCRRCGWRYRAAAAARRSRPPASSAKPLRRRRPPQPLAEIRHAPRRTRRAHPARRRSRARPTISHSLGRLSLTALLVPGLGRGDQRPGDFLQVAVGVEKALRQPLDQRRRRLVGAEMPRELVRRHARRSPDAAQDRRAPPAPARRRLPDRSCRSPSAGPAHACAD